MRINTGKVTWTPEVLAALAVGSKSLRPSGISAAARIDRQAACSGKPATAEMTASTFVESAAYRQVFLDSFRPSKGGIQRAVSPQAMGTANPHVERKRYLWSTACGMAGTIACRLRSKHSTRLKTSDASNPTQPERTKRTHSS